MQGTRINQNLKRAAELLAVLIAVLLLAACGLAAQPEIAAEPTDVPPTSTPEEPTATPTEPPTSTPEPTPTIEPTSTPDADAAHEKWEPLVSGGGLTVASYEMMFEVADGLAADDIDGADAFGQMLGVGVVIGLVGEALNEWEAAPDQAELKEALVGHIDAILDGIGGWMNGEIPTAEALHEALDEEFGEAQTTFAEVLAVAQADGLSDESIEQIVDELETTMADLEETMSEE